MAGAVRGDGGEPCRDEPHRRHRPCLHAGGGRAGLPVHPGSARLQQPAAPHNVDTFDHLKAEDMRQGRSEEHTSELQSLMRISYAVFCLKKKKEKTYNM